LSLLSFFNLFLFKKMILKKKKELHTSWFLEVADGKKQFFLFRNSGLFGVSL
jgi:hypothetical protein